MATYPEPLKTWYAIVKATVERQAMHVVSIAPSQLVGQVVKDNKYRLYLSFKNKSNVELVYKNI